MDECSAESSQARAGFDEAGSDRVGRGLPEDVLDELLPEDFDWEDMVTRYPSPSLAVAVAAGFFVGYRHGTEIVNAVGSFLSTRVERAADNLLGED